MELEFHQVAFQSHAGTNYLVLVHDSETGRTAMVDAGDASAALDAADEKGWKITDVWITHHHNDHVDGLAAIKAETGARAVGPRDQSAPIAHLDELVGDGDTIEFGAHQVEVISTPGHTLDMVNYYLPDSKVVFVGDTLFSLGCGRMFEGTPEVFWASLQRLAALPDDVMVYCGHEYTESNGDFALTVEPNNEALIRRMKDVTELRAQGLPTVPFLLGEDLAANPFMRANHPELRTALGMEDAPPSEVFAEIRCRKDRF